jgi:hypothetical protein
VFDCRTADFQQGAANDMGAHKNGAGENHAANDLRRFRGKTARLRHFSQKGRIHPARGGKNT